MASAYLFQCAGADGVVIANTAGSLGGNDGRGVPHCPSGGTWTLIEYAEPAQAFNPADLDPAILAEAFGAGLVVVGTGMVIAWAIKAVIRQVRGSF
ncbi:hypothetical protein E4T66_20465 [Sinimarinibacterium sp. CAU 1509]|uniref:hypothetical protein n=1 Tax=Sinimarinibacterium sp. CAU 1509 TaxID=2562283 RepID=UPI0010AB925B|nr:hypothetical protein [Sinimarinibacterium sp. CAU 1509]TJY55757.1 hypothetical protein E4T66_20465 [Sinimarinibacterium sp. CAU 1509]